MRSRERQRPDSANACNWLCASLRWRGVSRANAYVIRLNCAIAVLANLVIHQSQLQHSCVATLVPRFTSIFRQPTDCRIPVGAGTADWCMYTRLVRFSASLYGPYPTGGKTLRITPSLWTWRVLPVTTWNCYKFFPETTAILAGVVLPSTSRSIFLSRNSKLQQVLPRTYSSTSRGCAKQLAHDTFECNLTNAGRSRLQQVLPRTYSSTSGGRAKELAQRCRMHRRPFTL